MIKISRFYIVYILFISAGLYINLHADISVPMNKPFTDFPRTYNGWEMTGELLFSEEVLLKLRPTDYIMRKYVRTDTIPVIFYIGYHNGGKASGPIHSPKNCLPGGGWFKLSEDKVSVDVGKKKIQVMQAVFQKGESKEVFLYWYVVKGKTLTNEYALKIKEMTNSAFYRRRDAAFIRISVPFETDEGTAISAGIKFVQDFYSVINSFLPG